MFYLPKVFLQLFAQYNKLCSTFVSSFHYDVPTENLSDYSAILSLTIALSVIDIIGKLL